jgi:hypothetical protein
MTDYWDMRSDSSVLIQPVLQWGPSNFLGCVNGGSYWGIANYALNRLTCIVSDLKTVNVGDTIFGSMQKTSCGQNCWYWYDKVVDTTTQSASYQSLNNAPQMNNVYTSLETHNLVQCSDYPGGYGTTFYGLQVTGGTPGWWTEINPSRTGTYTAGCGEYLSIDAQGNPSQVSLYWKQQPSRGGGGSVALGTQILTPNGDVAVQNLNVGDTVISIDPFTQQLYHSTITSVNIVTVGNMLIFHTATGQPLRVDINPRLRFNAIHNGQPGLWSTVLLVPGDSLYQSGYGWTTITSIDRIYAGQHTYYDLHLDPLHDYIANGYADCPCKL